MNREERERMVDRLLNQALAPQEIEPRAGLEQRILENLRAQPKPWPWWRWAWVPAAVAAAVLLAISLRPARPAQPVKAPVTVEHRQAPPVSAEPATSSVVAVHRKPARRKTAPRALAAATTKPVNPGQPAFAPATLTEAERALIAVLRNNPGEAKVALERQEQTRQEIAEYLEQAFKPQE